MERGTRVIGGRYFTLFNGLGFYCPTVDDAPDSDFARDAAREMAAAKSKYKYVRLIKDRRKYKAWIYVFEDIDNPE